MPTDLVSGGSIVFVPPLIDRSDRNTQPFRKVVRGYELIGTHKYPFNLLLSTIVKSKSKKTLVFDPGLLDAINKDKEFSWIKDDKGDQTLHWEKEKGGPSPWDVRIVPGLGLLPNQVKFYTKIEDAAVTTTIEIVDGKPLPIRIELTPDTDGFLSAKVFSRLGFSAIHREMKRDMGKPVVQSMLRGLGDTYWDEPFLDIPRPGRKGRNDLDYAQWAKKYVDALSENPRRPVAILAKENPGFSEKTIRAILYKCRSRRGLLTKAPKGKAGGELTNKCIELLKNNLI